jgi:hypothetical protein
MRDLALYWSICNSTGIRQEVLKVSAARVHQITNQSQRAMMMSMVVLMKGAEVTGHTSVEYSRTESSRNSDTDSLEETEGRSEKVGTSSCQHGPASTAEAGDGGAALLPSAFSEAAAHMSDSSPDGQSAVSHLLDQFYHTKGWDYKHL